jgi:hypothetical protein
LQVVPDHDALIIQAHVSPHDMDRGPFFFL